jgi:peptidoglycan-associated lipoprotein
VKEIRRHSLFLTAIAALVLVAGCHKKPPAPPPAPPPPPPAPTASLSANPDSIQAGQSTTLTWQTQNATDITIDGIGAVEASGSKTVNPTDSTTYHLVAKGPGGTQEATARVTVTAAPPPPVSETEEQMFARNVQDVFFDYDKYDIRPDAQTSLGQAADFLKQHAGLNFTIEGHCDERGSTEYNLALGDKRANAAKAVLVRDGVDANRIKTISYGKEKPFCTESNEQCWQQNRRAHFVLNK